MTHWNCRGQIKIFIVIHVKEPSKFSPPTIVKVRSLQITIPPMVWCSPFQILQMNTWNIIYLNCREKYEGMIDHRSYLRSCEIKAWKKFRPGRDSVELITAAIPVQCSANWAIKPSGSFTFYGYITMWPAPR